MGSVEVYRWQKEFERHCTEKRLEPVEMTGDEIVGFLSEHDVGVTWTPATSHTLRLVTLTSDAFPTIKGTDLHQAVGKAAAWIKEENQ